MKETLKKSIEIIDDYKKKTHIITVFNTYSIWLISQIFPFVCCFYPRVTIILGVTFCTGRASSSHFYTGTLTLSFLMYIISKNIT